jgi:hypothetical protein
MGGKEALQKYYAAGLQRCLDAWSQLDEGDWAAKDSHGPWTARDYLAHLVTSQQFDLNAGTAANLAGKTTDLPGPSSFRDVDAFNARNLETVRDLGPRELMQRLRGLVEEHLGMLAPLSEADLERPAVNPGLHSPITIEITFDLGYMHLPLHYQDIRRCLRGRRRLPHWMDVAGEEETHDAMGRAFRIMPAFYWAERGRGLRASILFTLAGKGGGQWTVEIDDTRCSSHAGPPERVDVEIRVTPALYIDMQTHDMNPISSFLSGSFRVRPLTKLGLANRLEKLFAIT